MPSLLLVEDSEEMRMLVEVCLDDWEILEATSSDEALTLLASHTPDLVLIDSMLDDGPVEERLPELRAAFPRGPLLWFATKLPSAQFKELITGQISKPFEPDELALRLAEYLQTAG